jgi:hypothetical protein
MDDDQDYYHPERQSFVKCRAANATSWALPRNLPGGSHTVSLQLYRDGLPLTGPNSRVDVEFKIVIPEPPQTLSPSMEKNSGVASVHKNVVALPINHTKNSIHIFLMSSRSYDRYQEAIIMLKSLLFHHDPSFVRGALPAIHFHIVTDAAGKVILDTFLRENLKLDWIVVSFYDFTSTCEQMTDDFLRRFGFSISSHYSGKAGYCRLFVPQILSTNVDHVMAIETDQLFFRDIRELWDNFGRLMSHSEDAMFMMPEM